MAAYFSFYAAMVRDLDSLRYGFQVDGSNLRCLRTVARILRAARARKGGRECDVFIEDSVTATTFIPLRLLTLFSTLEEAAPGSPLAGEALKEPFRLLDMVGWHETLRDYGKKPARQN